jgi:hypothetical protein
MALRELENGAYDFDICLGSNQYSSGSALKLGWSIVGELKPVSWQSWLRVRQIARRMPLIPRIYHRLYNRSATQEPSVSAIRPFHVLDRNYNRTNNFSQSGVVLEEKPRPKAMAMLVDRQGYDGRIRHVRDEQFYAWRYQNPLSVYRFLFLEKTELKGFLVLQQAVVDTHSNGALIVDWEATSVEVFSDLLEAVIRWGGFSSISIWSMTLAGDMLKVLIKHGFCEAGKRRSSEATLFYSLIVKPLHSGGDSSMGGRDLLDISNWDLRPIYSDVY